MSEKAPSKNKSPSSLGCRRGVLCIGQIVADVVVRPVDRLPHPGRTDAVEELRLVAGGCSAGPVSSTSAGP